MFLWQAKAPWRAEDRVWLEGHTCLSLRRPEFASHLISSIMNHLLIQVDFVFNLPQTSCFFPISIFFLKAGNLRLYGGRLFGIRRSWQRVHLCPDRMPRAMIKLKHVCYLCATQIHDWVIFIFWINDELQLMLLLLFYAEFGNDYIKTDVAIH